MKHTKFPIILTILTALVISTFAFASPGIINVSLDGKLLNFDVNPLLIDGRTMVPFRAIFEALGAKVDWKGETQTVVAEKDGVTVTAAIGSKILYVNGKAKYIDIAPVIIESRTLVPARFIAESFGCHVEWNGDSNLVAITSPTSVNAYESVKTENQSETASYEPIPEIVTGQYWVISKVFPSYILSSVSPVQLISRDLENSSRFAVIMTEDGHYNFALDGEEHRVKTYQPIYVAGKLLYGEAYQAEPLMLDVVHSGIGYDKNVDMIELSNAPSQCWDLTYAEDDCFYISNVENGLYLTADASSSPNGAPVTLEEYSGEDNQKWRFEQQKIK